MNKRITFLILAFIAASINPGYSFSKLGFMSNFINERLFGQEISDSIIMVIDADPKGECVHLIKCITLKQLDGLMRKLNSEDFSEEEKDKILSYSFVPLKIINNHGTVQIVQMTVDDEDGEKGLFFRLEKVTIETFFFVRHGLKIVWHSGWVAWHLGTMAMPYAKQVVRNVIDYDYSHIPVPSIFAQDEELGEISEDEFDLEID